jgi:serine/threonine protein kinase
VVFPVVAALGATLGVFVLCGLCVMKNQRVLRHFAKRYKHSTHKLMPPLPVGAAALSLCASVWGIKEGGVDMASWHFWASVFGATTSVLSLVYGCYCMFAVWRTIRYGRGELSGMQEFARDWYYSEHHSNPTDHDNKCDSLADFASDALIESDFLGQMQRDRTRTKQRKQVAAAVELLDVDPGAVTWHEGREFAAGGFSAVWRVMYCGEVVAAKVVKRPGAQSIREAEKWLHGVKKEAAILHRLSACANIVNVLGIFERPDGAVVLMEYAAGGTLRDHIHGISMDDPSTVMGTGTGKSASTSGSLANTATGGASTAAAGVDEPLPPLEQAEQLSILVDIASGMLCCYSQDPPVQHR